MGTEKTTPADHWPSFYVFHVGRAKTLCGRPTVVEADVQGEWDGLTVARHPTINYYFVRIITCTCRVVGLRRTDNTLYTCIYHRLRLTV